MKNRIRFSVGMIGLISITLLIGFQNCERNIAVSFEKGKSTSTSTGTPDPNDPNSSDPNNTGNTNPNNNGGPDPVSGGNPIDVTIGTSGQNPLPTSQPTPTALPTCMPMPVIEAMERCKQASLSNTLRKEIVNINFPRPSISEAMGLYRCPWKSLDERWDQHYTSYSEQIANFNIPANAKLCDMKFLMETQTFHYDDHFIFSFDGFILASNSMGLMNYLPPSSSLVINQSSLSTKTFKWEKLLNNSWGDQGTSPSDFYCFAKGLPGVSCSWPITDTEGTISMAYPQELLLQMANQTTNASAHEFSFRTTGDNDENSDCDHSPFNFQIEVTYAP